MIIHDVEQNSEEWHILRAGLPTASCFDKICTPTGKASTQAEGYANLLIAEWMTGGQVATWAGNQWSERGHELEPEAAAYYELTKGVKLNKIGFCTDGEMIDGKPEGMTMGASPDRAVEGSDWLVEIKCPSPAVHISYLLKDKIDQGYNSQLQGQLLVTGKAGVDIVSYCPGLPPLIIPTPRDSVYISKMRGMLKEFNEMLAEKKARMIELGYSHA